MSNYAPGFDDLIRGANFSSLEPFKGVQYNRVPKDNHVAMGQNPVPPVNIPIPTKIKPKVGGEFTYQPKSDLKTVLTTTAMCVASTKGVTQLKTVSACAGGVLHCHLLQRLGDRECWLPLEKMRKHVQ